MIGLDWNAILEEAKRQYDAERRRARRMWIGWTGIMLLVLFASLAWSWGHWNDEMADAKAVVYRVE